MKRTLLLVTLLLAALAARPLGAQGVCPAQCPGPTVTAHVSWHAPLVATVETRVGLTTLTCARLMVFNRAAALLPANDVYVRFDSGTAAVKGDSSFVVLAQSDRNFNTGNFNQGNIIVSLISPSSTPASVECLP
jgi:hypothetical protein